MHRRLNLGLLRHPKKFLVVDRMWTQAGVGTTRLRFELGLWFSVSGSKKTDRNLWFGLWNSKNQKLFFGLVWWTRKPKAFFRFSWKILQTKNFFSVWFDELANQKLFSGLAKPRKILWFATFSNQTQKSSWFATFSNQTEKSFWFVHNFFCKPNRFGWFFADP